MVIDIFGEGLHFRLPAYDDLTYNEATHELFIRYGPNEFNFCNVTVKNIQWNRIVLSALTPLNSLLAQAPMPRTICIQLT